MDHTVDIPCLLDNQLLQRCIYIRMYIINTKLIAYHLRQKKFLQLGMITPTAAHAAAYVDKLLQ